MSPTISPRFWAALLLAGLLPALARPAAAAAVAAPGCGAAKKGWQFYATSSSSEIWKWAWDASGNGEIDYGNDGWPAPKTVSGCRYQCSQDEYCTFESRAAAAAGARAHAGRTPLRPKPRLTLRSPALRSGRTRPGRRAARAPRGTRTRSARRSPPARPRGDALLGAVRVRLLPAPALKLARLRGSSKLAASSRAAPLVSLIPPSLLPPSHARFTRAL
jgi:hypothetical protein